MEYLRSNESLQNEVERRLANLKNLNEAATKGRVKLQRSGPGEITVKRASMLDYFGNLMEDASDFSWDSAKACHAILLTNKEADRISWNETEKLHRIRRAHA